MISTPGSGSGQSLDDDLICARCGIPLLSRKTPCPKCGARWGEAPPPDYDGQPAPRSPHSTLVATAANTVHRQDTLLTLSMAFIAGVSLIFGLVSPFVAGFGIEDLWRALVLITLSLGLLGLRRLILGLR